MPVLTYVYIDYRKDGLEIARIQAANITEADEAFERQTGINPLKTFYIGCWIEQVL